MMLRKFLINSGQDAACRRALASDFGLRLHVGPEGGARVVEVHAADGTPIALDQSYSVAANNFIAPGGDRGGSFEFQPVRRR